MALARVPGLRRDHRVDVFVTYLAAKRVKASPTPPAAGCQPAERVGVAGDYLSAASFLGIAGLISIWGYDGSCTRWGGSSYITVLLVIARPCRTSAYTAGRYSRLPEQSAQRASSGAISVITVSTFTLPRRWSAEVLVRR
jgi:cation/acetate symporter